MDFYFGPADILVDGECFEVTAFVDSLKSGGLQDWGGFLEIGSPGDTVAFLALSGAEVLLRIPGISARDISIVDREADGLTFWGTGRTPLPLPPDRCPNCGDFS